MIPVIVPRTDIELNAKTALTELRGLLPGNTAEFGQFLIQKSKEWNFTVNELLGAFEKLSAEFSSDNKANKEVFRKVRKYLLNPTASDASIETITLDKKEKIILIISKYVDLGAIGEMTGNEFALKLSQNMPIDELVDFEHTVLGEDSGEVEPFEILTICTKELVKNGLLGSLLQKPQGIE